MKEYKGRLWNTGICKLYQKKEKSRWEKGFAEVAMLWNTLWELWRGILLHIRTVNVLCVCVWFHVLDPSVLLCSFTGLLACHARKGDLVTEILKGIGLIISKDIEIKRVSCFLLLPCLLYNFQILYFLYARKHFDFCLI